MKLTTSFAIVSLCLVGTACSESTGAADTSTTVATETAQVEDEYTGSLNLNLPTSSAAQDADTGSLNLRIGQSGSDDDLLIGSAGFGGGRFEDSPSLGLSLPDDTAEPAAAQATEDDVIRLDPK
ncbi:hypothetical protein [uncultured Hyphomonas sp.]|uniref:hypothetical protein n=1 Tax=uncultured Hyphomonas sp. TaxID=225298 RepID=UPI0030DB1E80